MKTLSLLSFAAALAAFVVLPVQIEVTGSVLFSSAVLVLVFADYRGRTHFRAPGRRVLVACAKFRPLATGTEAHCLAA